MGSIQLTPSITEIDHVPDSFRKTVGDIILTAAVIQEKLANLFAAITGVNPSIFVYLGHTLDTSQTIKALQRLIKSDDSPISTSCGLPDTLRRCIRVLEERNKIAHQSLFYVDNMLMRSEVRGGAKPHRVFQVLELKHFTDLIEEMKCVLWELRSELMAIQRRQ